jgi:hypothetical protein
MYKNLYNRETGSCLTYWQTNKLNEYLKEQLAVQVTQTNRHT